MLKSILRAANLLPLCILAVHAPAFGQMIPLEDLRRSSIHVIYMDDEDFQEHLAPGGFAAWEDYCVGVAEQYEPCPEPPPDQCLVGDCTGGAYQNSQFFPAGIQLSGTTGASWWGPQAGHYLLTNVSGFKFRVDETFDYDLYLQVEPGDSPIVDNGIYAGAAQLSIFNSAGSPTILYTTNNGQLGVTGRLGPGTYQLEAWSGKFGAWEQFQGPTYFAQWTIQQPQAPAVAVQPADRSVACGGTAVFTVGTAGPLANYTFQWRRNFVPLTDGPGVAGATTSTLTLTNVCTADDYDVVVTGPNPGGGGTVAEPSRLAHLNVIMTPTGVELEPTSPAVAAVGVPAPNPFRASTTVTFDAPKTTRLVADVYNAAGARVRSLAARTVSGPGSVTWDGRLRSGANAPVGIYFLRVELDGLRQTRKVVLLQ